MFTNDELIKLNKELQFKRNLNQDKLILKNGWMIQYITYPTLKTQIEAIRQDPLNFKYIESPFEETLIELVKHNGNNIKLIKNPSEKVCIEALYNNPECIEFIDIKKYPELYELYIFLTK